jgi:hypothetical protein
MLSASKSDFEFFYRNKYFKIFNPYHLNADGNLFVQGLCFYPQLSDLIGYLRSMMPLIQKPKLFMAADAI